MCLSSFKLMVTVISSKRGSVLFTIFLKGSAYIVGKLVVHPCVPFRSGAPLTFFGAPRLKSIDYAINQKRNDEDSRHYVKSIQKINLPLHFFS